jgi:tripartite-type tricarboxylate transporter receptor subunit TctC
MPMSSRLGVLTAVCVTLCLPSYGIAQDAVAEFYRGKQVTLAVSTGPGGSASLYAQAVAHHMGRHMPGNPGIIVQHVPGAGGLVAANTAYNTAPRDGSYFITTSRTAPLDPLFGNPNAKFDARKFNWIGTANVEITTCISWFTAPVKTLQEAFTTELVVGGYGADGISTIFPKAVNKLTGTKFKVITGYQGSTEIMLAMERGENGGFCAIGWTFLKLRKTEWLREKKINILFQMAMEKHPDIPDVPLILDYAKTPDDRKVFELLFAPQEMGRPFFAPPGIPAERVQALRAAFERTLKDPQFLAEADKMGLEVQHLGGEHVHSVLEKIYAAPREVIERVKTIAD